MTEGERAREGGSGQQTISTQSANNYFIFRQLDLLILIKFNNYLNNLIIVELAYHIR